MGHAVKNTMDVQCNKQRLKEILKDKGMKFIDLWAKLSENYGVGLEYNSFINLINNHITWRLLYAYAVCDFLDIKMKEVFFLADDVEPN